MFVLRGRWWGGGGVETTTGSVRSREGAQRAVRVRSSGDGYVRRLYKVEDKRRNGYREVGVGQLIGGRITWLGKGSVRQRRPIAERIR